MKMPSSDPRPRLLVLFTTGWAVRNYVHGGFLERLRRSMHITLALRFRDEALEGLLRPCADEICEFPAWGTGRLGHWISHIVIRAHKYHRPNEALRLRRDEAWQEARNDLARKTRLALMDFSGRALSSAPVFRRAVNLERRFMLAHYRGSAADRFLDEHRPDVVFSTMPSHLPEAPVLRLAKARGIPMATAVLSWDNLATKGYLPVVFDRYFLWSDVMAHDLRHYYSEVTESQIARTGTPQFDLHGRQETVMSRSDYCRALGFDPDRPIVTYSTSPSSFLKGEEWIVERLAEGIQANRIPGQPQLLVRLHPLDEGSRFAPAERFGARVVRPWALDPRIPTWSYPTEKDMTFLWATLAHTAVNVNFGSTMTIDFAVLDKPVINVAIDTPASLAHGFDLMRAYAYEHYKRVLDNKAVRLVRTVEELFTAITDYLRNPERDADGRRRLVAQICGTIDGHAADRIAADLMNFSRWGSA